MQNVLEKVERFIAVVLTWLISHIPLPARFRRAVRSKRDVIDEMVKFALAGAVATIVFLIVFYICLFADPNMPAWVASVIANVPSITVSYVIAATFVFKQESSERRHFEIVMFFAFAGFAVLVQTVALGVVERLVGHRLSVPAATLVVFVATIFNWSLRFVSARFLIFKSHLDRPAFDVPTELAHVSEELNEADDPRASQGDLLFRKTDDVHR